MSLRTCVLLCFVSLLAACSSEPAKPPQTQVLAQPETDAPADLGPLPAYQRELSGVLTGAPKGAEVELAILIVDERGRPQGLMASSKIIGNNLYLNRNYFFAKWNRYEFAFSQPAINDSKTCGK